MTFCRWWRRPSRWRALPIAAGWRRPTPDASTARSATQSNAFVPGASVTVKNEKTGEDAGRDKANGSGLFSSSARSSLRPTRSPSRRPASRHRRVHADAAGRRPGTGARLRVQAGRRQESVTVVGTAPVLDISSARIGANVSEREVQGLPVNGRQMSQLLLQAPGSQNAGTGTWQDIRFSGRANEQNVIKYDGIEGSAIIDCVAGQRERREPHAVQAAGEPRERPGVPRRIEQLPGRVRHRHRRPGERHHQVGRQQRSTARCSSTSAATSSTRANHFDSPRNLDGSVISDSGRSRC